MLEKVRPARSNKLRNSTGEPSLLYVIRSMLSQLADVFHTSPYIHIGGDEVDFKCWSEDAALVSF